MQYAKRYKLGPGTVQYIKLLEIGQKRLGFEKLDRTLLWEEVCKTDTTQTLLVKNSCFTYFLYSRERYVNSIGIFHKTIEFTYPRTRFRTFLKTNLFFAR